MIFLRKVFIFIILFCNFLFLGVCEKSSKGGFFVSAGPSLYVNTDDSTAPSPISYAFGIGYNKHLSQRLSFQPHCSFHTQYFQWHEENARPAEIENRTALALCFMTDFVFCSQVNKNAETPFNVGLGIASLFRYGFLANGVSASDYGESGTASEDVELINSWFMKDLRFLYPEIYFSLLHKVRNIYIGAECRLYVPVSLFSKGASLDTSIACVAFRIGY